MKTLTGKFALVTGGGTGMGRAIALSLARQGAGVIVNYSKSAAEAAHTCEDVAALGVPAMTVQADVSNDGQVAAMVAQVEKKFGRLDILINNAGFTRFVDNADLYSLDEQDWERTFHVNVNGTFYCCRAAAPLMKKNGWGRIVNIASVAGFSGRGSSIAYAASKAAVISLTKSLAQVLAPEITVNAVAPGLIETRWLDGVAHVDQLRKSFLANSLLGRVGTPEDVAEVATSLVTNMNFVTGQTIVVDAGRMM